jgi:phosphate/sulfate permease
VLIVSWIFIRSTPIAVDNFFRVLQLASAALYSLGHGGNDAQKTMGIIAVLLYSQGALGRTFYVPFWVILSCQLAMGLGTLLGGWRIVRTECNDHALDLATSLDPLLLPPVITLAIRFCRRPTSLMDGGR